MAGSPLPEIILRVVPGLQVSLEASAQPAEVGGLTEFGYMVRNPGPEALDIEAVTVDVPEGFHQVEMAAGGGFQAEADRRMHLTGPVRLDPGEGLRVVVRAVPLRAGQSVWKGWYRPAGHRDWLPASGRPTLAVAMPAAPEVGSSAAMAGGPPTDIGAVTEALKAAMSGPVASLPVQEGTAIRLVADDATQKKNWVVEDALAAILMKAGHRLQLEVAEEVAAPAAARLHYRLLSSKVIYTPRRGGWNPFASGQERQTETSVLLRLVEPDGEVTWAHRIRSSGTDPIPGGASAWLGGGQGADRIEVPADFGILEVGLSGLIVGGLMFVFFVP